MKTAVASVETTPAVLNHEFAKTSTRYYSRVIKDLVRKAEEKNDLLFLPPQPAFRFNKDRTFNFKYFIDLRWGKFEWQKVEYRIERVWEGGRWKVVVKMFPRRHGKTHYEVFTMRDKLLQVKRSRPIGAYYCIDKGQAIRNAWNMFHAAVGAIPGSHVDESKGTITIPRPTLLDPHDFITIYFFGIRGGSGSKRGGYYDVVCFDEVEYMEIKFVQEVGFGSAFDRDGEVRLLGTPAGHGNLDYWLSESRKREVVAEAVERGESVSKERIEADTFQWKSHRANCWTLKVYSKKRLMEIKAKMTPESFAQEFECDDSLVGSGFYHRDKVYRIREQGNINNNIRFNPHLALRAHFDIGLGNKSDRMAFTIDQFGKQHISFLWGEDVLSQGYYQAAQALRESKYGNMFFWEVVLPHDANTREQSDAIPKIEKFEDALKEAGVKFGSVRALYRSTDKHMDTNLVTALLDMCFFHEIDAYPLIEALEMHKKKWNKTALIWEPTPSKTKFRDRADAVRGAILDFHSKQFQDVVVTPHGIKPVDLAARQEKFSGNTPQGVANGYHPSQGSVIINPDGSFKDPLRTMAGNGGMPSNFVVRL